MTSEIRGEKMLEMLIKSAKKMGVKVGICDPSDFPDFAQF
jgi:predicted peroxiredoxin